ncbi:OadG-related small transporter subunit [Enterococcus camelliae]|jgi:Na+-transporting methylmalonyl-CoA/oxaloacetate decarboxylase gamma subunit|uniref:OadG-related small transporter subunit n=1 Tax=Enterococcus camelliae TaxID=453959 RepID=A0ABW5THQ9_9ENTE
MNINIADLKQSFELLIMGWGGVFFVLFLIYLASKVLAKLFPPKK